jgi:hypothetical protein
VSNRLLQRQGEVERQHILVVVDPIVDRRLELDELVVLALEMDEGEIVELLERLDIDLGERRELLLRVDAVLVGVEAFDRHRGIELIEGPVLADSGDLVIGPKFDLRADRGPDMGMCGGDRREGEEGGQRQG